MRKAASIDLQGTPNDAFDIDDANALDDTDDLKDRDTLYDSDYDMPDSQDDPNNADCYDDAAGLGTLLRIKRSVTKISTSEMVKTPKVETKTFLPWRSTSRQSLQQ
jgi:hypothetical protein